MERIFIAEKPELADAIADVLGITEKCNGYYRCGSDAVTWCFGHMLELCAPEDYDEKYSNWDLDHLPIVHIPWKYKPIQRSSKQLKIIKKLIDDSSVVVHAGDPDPEGQLLVDEILENYRITKPVKRVLINDLNKRIVERALGDLRENSDFHGLSQSALARSVGDQLYGFNMTRLYTLKAREKGADGVFSVGRVQTPILGLIVRRDREIASHTKAYYYTVSGQFSIEGVDFKANFKPNEDAPLDDSKRITSEEFANGVVAAVTGQTATISQAKTEDKSEPPPLPYDLLELQADASRKFGIDPDQTLNLTQELREKKLITYNRSDCRYLNEEQHEDVPLILSVISENAPQLAGACGTADASIKGRCFDNDNVNAHHGIIPAEGRYPIDKLSENQRKIYQLIARQYIAQFWANKESKVTTVFVEVEGHTFKASSTEVVSEGWSRLYKNDKDNEEVHKPKSDDEVDCSLNSLSTGNDGRCTSAKTDKKETKPPKHYTQSTLLKDLKRVAKYVTDPAIAKLLREKDKGKKGEQGGIGTPATRDSFVVKLIERGYVQKKGTKITSTDLGQSFHDTLPSFATQPDLTALWHEQQKDIEAGSKDTMGFINELVDTVSEHITEIKASELNIRVVAHDCPTCKKGKLNKRKGKYGSFWACNQYPECKASFPDKGGKPDFTPKAKPDESEFKCGECDKPLVRRKSKAKKGKKPSFWYGCSGFPGCKATYFEKNGKPDYDAKKDTA